MRVTYILLLNIFTAIRLYARDAIATDFVKSFLINERKPTYLIFSDLCWTAHQKLKLVKAVSDAGFSSSRSFDMSSHYLYHHAMFLLDLNCFNANDVPYNATSRKLFSSPFRWLMLTNSVDKKELSSVFNSPILTDSEVVLAERIGDAYTVTELHKTSVNAPMTATAMGYYNGTLTDARVHTTRFRRRRDVMGHSLTMAIVIQDSNTTQYHLPLEDRLEPQYDSISKICWMEVKLAFQMLNATPRYIFSHRWGYKQDGRWSGMIDDLRSGRADLGTNCLVSDSKRLDVVFYTEMVAPFRVRFVFRQPPLSYLHVLYSMPFADSVRMMVTGNRCTNCLADHERLDVVSFTDMAAPFRVRFVFRQPPLSYVTNIYSLPFAASVWAAIAVCTAVATATLYLESKWEKALGTSPTQLDGSIGDALLLTMSAVSQQGCVLEPRKFSGRIMEWFLFAALMALYAAYSANIVVLLQAPSNSIRTLAQLADSKITLGAIEVDYSHFIFSRYKDPVRVKIYKRIDPEKGKGQFYDINEGVERIRQGLFAFHSITEPVYRRIEKTFLETEKCDLQEVDLVNGFDPFIPVKKDSPYLELLRVVFKRIRESGIQSALVKRMQVPKPRCHNKVSSFSSAGLLDLRPVLVFMLYGAALAMLLLLAEILYSKMNISRFYSYVLKKLKELVSQKY